MNFVNKLKEKKNLVILAAISNIEASTLKWKMRFPYHILENRLQYSNILHWNYFIWVLAFYLSQKNKLHSEECSQTCISKTMASKTIYFTPLKRYGWKQAYKRNNLFQLKESIDDTEF